MKWRVSMTNSNEKGGLIKKKTKKPLLKPTVRVKKVQNEDFGYNPNKSSNMLKKNKVSKTTNTKKSNTFTKSKSKQTNVGKRNSNRSIKVSSTIHNEITLLGSFIDESVIYKIVQTMIDSYVKNELTDRQQRQFEFMVAAMEEEE